MTNPKRCGKAGENGHYCIRPVDHSGGCFTPPDERAVPRQGEAPPDGTLLPCPFCGHAAPERFDKGSFKWIGCGSDDCDATSGRFMSYDEAIAAWNRRPTAGTEVGALLDETADLRFRHNPDSEWERRASAAMGRLGTIVNASAGRVQDVTNRAKCVNCDAPRREDSDFCNRCFSLAKAALEGLHG